jgi:hypothetical protein
LAQDFAALVRQRQPERLDAWLARAATSALQALRRLAKGLGEDYEAVKAGVTLPWSTGPVEGHINRLKMLKRQMFGRARLDLLSRRFVRTPGGGQGPAHPGAMAASPQASAGMTRHHAWRPSGMSRDGDQEREAIASWSDGTAGLLGVAVGCIVYSPNVTKSAQEPT